VGVGRRGGMSEEHIKIALERIEHAILSSNADDINGAWGAYLQLRRELIALKLITD
jgi:hypothetical protein